MKSIAGRIVTHKKDFIGTIYFDENTGLISSIEPGIHKDTEYYSEKDCVIFPGFGDIHIHAREDISAKHVYKEDFVSVGKAALNGGVTHLADMPNNPVPPIDDNSYNSKLRLSTKSPIHITLYAGIGPGTRPLQKDVPYKVFMGPSIGELYFHNNEELEKVIQFYEGQNVSFHCEDPEILDKNKTQDKHEDRRPPIAEITATDFALYLIQKYKLKGKLCHYSTGEGLSKIKQAKKDGLSVTCEVTPTHIFFDRTMLTQENYFWFQMNPPLRSPEDRDILLNALRDGEIDYLATDHAPHSIEEKYRGISGISQLDTYSLFVTWLILEKKISLQRIASVCAKNPGDFVNPYLPASFGNGFGYIEPNYSANFTILNLSKSIVFEKEMIQSKSGWSPFENYTFPGSIEAVYYLGKKN